MVTALRLTADSTEVRRGLLRLVGKLRNPRQMLEEIGRELAAELAVLTPVQELAGAYGGRLRQNMVPWEVRDEGGVWTLIVGDEANLGVAAEGSGTGLGLIGEFFAQHKDLRGWVTGEAEQQAAQGRREKVLKKFRATRKGAKTRARHAEEARQAAARRQREIEEAADAWARSHPWWKAYLTYRSKHPGVSFADYTEKRGSKQARWEARQAEKARKREANIRAAFEKEMRKPQYARMTAEARELTYPAFAAQYIAHRQEAARRSAITRARGKVVVPRPPVFAPAAYGRRASVKSQVSAITAFHKEYVQWARGVSRSAPAYKLELGEAVWLRELKAVSQAAQAQVKAWSEARAALIERLESAPGGQYAEQVKQIRGLKVYSR